MKEILMLKSLKVILIIKINLVIAIAVERLRQQTTAGLVTQSLILNMNLIVKAI